MTLDFNDIDGIHGRYRTVPTPVPYVPDYRTTDLVTAVNDATGGRGADVAFDTVGGEVTRQTFRCMAFNGRHVIAGFASGVVLHRSCSR